MCVKWKLVSVRFEIALVLAQDRYMVCAEYWHGNHFGHTRSYSYVTLVKRKLVSICLEVLLISGQHRYTVCAECTMGMEIILGTTDATPRCRESCGSSCRSIRR